MISNSGELRPGKLSPGKSIPRKVRPGKLIKEVASGFRNSVIKLLKSLSNTLEPFPKLVWGFFQAIRLQHSNKFFYLLSIYLPKRIGEGERLLPTLDKLANPSLSI